MTTDDAVISVTPLGFPWQTVDPFLFCVHHDDAYPRGNAAMGPDVSLAGRRLGQDFEIRDGFRMYHGEVVPGFPEHPHRGFETVTLARRGFIDHSDSLGAAARFGRGDVQWMTAGRGVVHAEMFPLLDREGPNPVELFQIWLNLPRADKLVEPHFAMLWNESIPRVSLSDDRGRTTEVTVIAGEFLDSRPPPPPPRSYATRPEADIAIRTYRLAPHARVRLEATHATTHRMLYFFRGSSMHVAGSPIPSYVGVRLLGDREIELVAGDDECELLLLQGRPIGEPVVQYGPFVMNTAYEVQQAFADYRRTQFGGWPWARPDPVHPREEGRFARHADGRVEKR